MPPPRVVVSSVWLCYPGVVQLTLQAVDLLGEPQGLDVRGGQAGGQSFDLALGGDTAGRKMRSRHEVEKRDHTFGERRSMLAASNRHSLSMICT